MYSETQKDMTRNLSAMADSFQILSLVILSLSPLYEMNVVLDSAAHTKNQDSPQFFRFKFYSNNMPSELILARTKSISVESVRVKQRFYLLQYSYRCHNEQNKSRIFEVRKYVVIHVVTTAHPKGNSSIACPDLNAADSMLHQPYN
jgi:hypothetical protein